MVLARGRCCLQALRGVALLSAITLMAEIGDFRRFANPRELMAWLGLVRESTPPAPARSAARSPRPATPAPAGPWSRVPGPIVCRRASVANSSDATGRCPKPSRRSPGKLSSGCAPVTGVSCAPESNRVVTVAIARELAASAWAIATNIMPPPPATVSQETHPQQQERRPDPHHRHAPHRRARRPVRATLAVIPRANSAFAPLETEEGPT